MEWVDSYDQLPKLEPKDYMKIISPNESEKVIIYYIDGSKACYNIHTQEIINLET